MMSNKYSHRDHHDKRKGMGLCPRCGSKILDSYIYCKICREKRRNAKRSQESLNKRKDWVRLHVLGTKNGQIRGITKRPYSSRCELCNREDRRRYYHHWDDNNPSIGTWLCYLCHMFSEYSDKGFYNKYIELKNKIQQGGE